MKTTTSHRFYSTFLALLMLISSTGFSVDIHYCQDSIAGISFFGKADCCKSKMQSTSCHASKSVKVGIKNPKKDDCCHNESIVIEKSDIEAPITHLSFNQDFQLCLFIPFITTNPKCIIGTTGDRNTFALYKPPLPERDIYSLYQTFLI